MNVWTKYHKYTLYLIPLWLLDLVSAFLTTGGITEHCRYSLWAPEQET